MIVIEILLLMLGFTLLSLSMTRHFSDVTNKKHRLSKSAMWLFRGIGYSMLVIALLLGLQFWGGLLAFVYWFGSAMFVTLVLTAILTFCPNLLSFIGIFLKEKS